LRIAAILPHLKPFGGVRRFLEIGNVFTAMGHQFTIYPTDYEEIDWFAYTGKISPPGVWVKDEVCLIGDPPSFDRLQEVALPSEKIFVYVIAGEKYLPMYAKLYNNHPFIVNNRVFLEEFPTATLIEGGVNTTHFWPEGKIRVLYYAGRGRIKGEETIVEALKDIDRVTLIPLKDIPNADLPGLYSSADYFVSWESRPGWSNTAAEALSCGLTVVTNGRNCEPFVKFCIQLSSVTELTEFFGGPMNEFDWKVVCEKLLELWKEHGIG